MADLLTRKGARNLTRMMDRVASVIQAHPDSLGIPAEVALDYAKRSDLLSDTIELKAAENYPVTAAGETQQVDKTPAADNDPEVPQPSAESAGPTDEDPKSDDQNKPETYYEGGSSKVAEDDALLRKLLAEEGMTDKKAAPEWAQPAKDETGTSVEPTPAAQPHWDANAIADDRGGPYLAESDEPYMSGQFAQNWFHQLHDKQVAGVLPQVDAKLASLADGDVEGLRDIAAGMRRIIEADVGISKMPGMSPSQLRGEIDRIVKLRQEIEKIATQYEAVLKQLKDLEKEEKAGLATLKKAAGEMREKGKYLAETETALLQFTAYLTEKRPGIEQMIARGDEYKGQKAGDFFGRVATQLGDETAAAVESIYEATKEDLSHTKMAVRGLKVVQKAASFDEGTLKQAGVTDMIVSLKEWIAGKADSVAQRILGFAGDISKWFRGFVERTKIVRKKSTGLKSVLDDAMKAMDGALATAGRIASDKGAADESDDEACGEDKVASDNQQGFNLFE
jgi:hypothetical protein